MEDSAPVHFRDGSKRRVKKKKLKTHLLDYLDVLERARAFFQGQKLFTQTEIY